MSVQVISITLTPGRELWGVDGRGSKGATIVYEEGEMGVEVGVRLWIGFWVEEVHQKGYRQGLSGKSERGQI